MGLLTKIQADKINFLLSGLSSKGHEFFNSVDTQDIKEFEQLLDVLDEVDPTAKAFVCAALEEIKSNGRSPAYTALLAKDWLRKPVDVQTFIEDPYYLGEFGKDLYPVWKEALKDIFSPGSTVYEVILTGAIGIGKNTFSSFLLTYVLYLLSCLIDPPRYYGLMAQSNLIFGIYSVVKYKADSVTYSRISEYVNNSPYFVKHFPRNARKKYELLFPKNIKFIAGSQGLHALSENIFAFELDEANFMHTKGGEQGQAYNLYTTNIRRLESRFMSGGRIPGFVLAISSKRSHADFLEAHIKEKQGNPCVRIYNYTQWDVKPSRYAGGRFPVFIGDKFNNPKILRSDQVGEYDNDTVLMVPNEHRESFEAKIDESLRDLAGVSVTASSPFIRDKEKLLKNVSFSRPTPLLKMEFPLSTQDTAEIENYIDKDVLFLIRGGKHTPRINRNATRFIHVDLSLTGCPTGFCMGHISGVDYHNDAETGSSGDIRPHIYLDLIIRILAPDKGEIDFGKIRKFILYLRDHGFNIGMITYDSFESSDTLQMLASQGFEVDKVSTVRTDVPFGCLRSALMEERLHMYNYPPALDEL